MQETCEDRDYRCCELMPPVVVIDGEAHTELTEDEYDAWYDAHVAAFETATPGPPPTTVDQPIGRKGADLMATTEAPDRDTLLWLDLETTGSDESKDSIIEVGCILTTTDLQQLGEFSAVVTPEAEGYGRMMLNEFVHQMHTTNGLLADISNGQKPHEVTKALLTWAKDLGAKEGRTVLAGSGVAHFDRRFIARYMPQLDRFLRYWVIDIGVIRRAHEMWVGTVVSSANESKTHRALDDIRCHLEEAQAFKAHWAGAEVAPSKGDDDGVR